MSSERPDLPTRTYDPGDVIFREGEASLREAYLIHSGRVEISRSTGADETRRTLVAGDVLGEVSLFRDGAHSATAVAVEAVTLLVIPASRLERMVRTSPDLAMALIRQLAQMAAGREDDAGR
jgi:CRP/FNR family transcriptional regulator, cyclic AMP receptor protein